MGNFEKFVVLVVLLASAGALAVSLNNSETTQGTPSSTEFVPGEAVSGKSEGTPKQLTSASLAKPAAKAPSKPKSTLPKLDAGFQAAKQAAKTMPSKNGMPYILVNKEGLKPSFMPETYMTFEPSKKDTWMTLAKRFYGNNRYVNAIKMANEGVGAPADVDVLMIPLYDFSMEQTKRAAFEPAPALAKQVFRGSDVGTTPASAKKPAVASNPNGGITYTVASGDSLSLISYKVYGKASRWREIYAANRDKMKNENSLKLGMKLYVPKAGEFKSEDTRETTGVH